LIRKAKRKRPLGRPRRRWESNIIMNLRDDVLVGHVARVGKMRNVYKILVEKSGGKRPFGIPRRRWEDNIRMHLREMGLNLCIGFIWLRIGTSGGRL
jgi:hypothetical protein